MMFVAAVVRYFLARLCHCSKACTNIANIHFCHPAVVLVFVVASRILLSSMTVLNMISRHE